MRFRAFLILTFFSKAKIEGHTVPTRGDERDRMRLEYLDGAPGADLLAADQERARVRQLRRRDPDAPTRRPVSPREREKIKNEGRTEGGRDELTMGGNSACARGGETTRVARAAHVPREGRRISVQARPMTDASRPGGIDRTAPASPHAPVQGASNHAHSAPVARPRRRQWTSRLGCRRPREKEASCLLPTTQPRPLPSLSPHAGPAASRRGLRRPWRRRRSAPVPPWGAHIIILGGCLMIKSILSRDLCVLWSHRDSWRAVHRGCMIVRLMH